MPLARGKSFRSLSQNKTVLSTLKMQMKLKMNNSLYTATPNINGRIGHNELKFADED